MEYAISNYRRNSRDEFIESIKTAGRYISDHADNLLGEYPALLGEMELTVTFSPEQVLAVEVRRSHMVCEPENYPYLKKGGE